MSLQPPPKMLSRVRDEEGRAYHAATMQKRRADAMALVRLKEFERLQRQQNHGPWSIEIVTRRPTWRPNE